MLKRIFLKLDGVRGESKSPRHIGEIEISSVTWSTRHQHSSGAGVERGRASIDDLTLSKQSDQTSSILWRACTTGQNFADGLLTLENISEAGGLLNSVTVKLVSILVCSVAAETTTALPSDGVMETVVLNCEKLEVMRQ